jgi:recombination protein RecA
MATMAAPDREKALENALAQIERAHGKGSVMRLGDEVRSPIEVIPTGSIALDVALGIGGLPRGRIVEIYGPESSGKTTLALHAVANAQRAGGIAAFIDAEHALDPEYASKLGVDSDALLVSQPDTGEQALEIADTLIRSGAIDIIVIDSVAALVPRAEIEGEMGDSHVGLQARLMSQALRKITGALSNSGTTAIFINQLREKIGVFFGCFHYNTRVTLADGTQEKIGKIVNQKMAVEVLSYDPETDRIVPRKIVNWFDNGPTDEFLQFTVAKSGKNGRAQFAATANHLIRTPGGWCPAGELLAGDRVMVTEPHRLSSQQMQVVLGSLMGDGNLSSNRRDRSGVRFRLGHGPKQVDYLDWKVSLFANIGCSRRTNATGAVFADFTPLPELDELRQAVYFGDGKKHLSDEYLKALTPLALAIWYMDDGCFTARSKGVQERTQGGSGRIEICVDAMSIGTRDRMVDYLRDTHGLDAKLITRGARAQQIIQFTTASSAAFQEIVAPWVHPSMEYKLLPRFRGLFHFKPEFVAPSERPVPARILDIHVKPKTRSMHRFDIEVEGNHNYFVDGVMVHNSPETTTGGKALKFYASIRIDVRRIETLKDGQEAVGNRTRAKVVKNKCLAEGSLVFDPVTGLTHRIEDIVDGHLPVSVVSAAKDNSLHIRPVVSWFDQGMQQVLGLRTEGGNTLRVTPDHKVLTDQGWVLAGDVKVGDRLARPRRFLGFGTTEPVTPDHARMLGETLGDESAEYAAAATVPAYFFQPDTSADVVANLIFGLLETGGHISKTQTGAIHVGFTTTSEQLAQQIHWLLLRFGISSWVRLTAKRPVYEVRISGIDNVAAFSEAIPMWGPRGQVLVAALTEEGIARHRGSQGNYLAGAVTEPVLAHLLGRVTAREAAALVGTSAGNPGGGMRQVLGMGRLRRDRVQALADALDDPFLHEVLAEEVRYSVVREVLPIESMRTFDVEVDEFHTLVANDIVVHNCAPPFRQAEFDIIYNQGISREGSLIDMGVDNGIVRKSGAWYTYEGDQLGQGKENSRTFLKDNPDLADEIEKKIKEKLGIGPRLDVDVPIDLTAPVPIDL